MKHNKKKQRNIAIFKMIITLFILIELLSVVIITISKTIKTYTANPNIELIGDEELILNVNDIYEEQGAKASLNNETLIPKISGNVDTSIPGEYTITYTVSNEKGKNTQTLERKVIVKDNIPPTIELNGNSTLTLTVGSKYEEKGASAKDNIDGDITSKIIVDGTVDSSNPGTYELEYNISDSSGNTASIKRTVKVIEKKVSSTTASNGLPVLMYHFFYDKTKSSGTDNNWMEISDFEAQMKYLSENDFYFPSWEEVEQYIDGKISLPSKSIVITVDDGDPSFFELAVPIIQKYNVKATSFVITSWYGYRASNKQSNISYESHSDYMHEGASNGKGVMLSWSYDKILEDVTNSSKTLGGATVFCYPFGQYNDLDKKVLKDAGYKLAFTTEAGRVYKGSDKFALPRVRMSRGVSLSSFKSMVN